MKDPIRNIAGEIIMESEPESFRRASLPGADLGKANLWGGDFRGANFREVDFRRANFREADLWRADFRRANFREADFRRADFREADLWRADFRGAQLQGAKNITFNYFPSISFFMGPILGDFSDGITLELMRRDAWSHPCPEKFDEWAKGGKCPYEKNEDRTFFFAEKRELWKPGPPEMRDADLIRAICREKGWKLPETTGGGRYENHSAEERPSSRWRRWRGA